MIHHQNYLCSRHAIFNFLFMVKSPFQNFHCPSIQAGLWTQDSSFKVTANVGHNSIPLIFASSKKIVHISVTQHINTPLVTSETNARCYIFLATRFNLSGSSSGSHFLNTMFRVGWTGRRPGFCTCAGFTPILSRNKIPITHIRIYSW